MVSIILTLVMGAISVILYMYFSETKERKDLRLRTAFQAKKIVLTGGSAGMGAEMAYQLTSLGAKVVVVGRRVDRLEDVAKRCNVKRAMSCHHIKCDVSSEEDCKKMVDEAAKWLGGIDVLILNAGKGCIMSVEESVENPAVYSQIMSVNYLGCVYPTVFGLKWLYKSQKPQIIVNSSMAGIGWTPGRSAYSASKHALRGFFNSLRCEETVGAATQKRNPITITTVYPGFVMTEIHDRAVTPSGKKLQRQKGEFMSCETAVELILDGAAKGKREFTLEWVGSIGIYITALFPTVADWIFIKKADAGLKIISD